MVFRLVARLVSQKMIFGSHDHTTTSVMILCHQSVLVTLWTKPVYVANIWRTNHSMEKSEPTSLHPWNSNPKYPSAPPEFVCKTIDKTTKWSLKMGIFAHFQLLLFNPICVFLFGSPLNRFHQRFGLGRTGAQTGVTHSSAMASRWCRSFLFSSCHYGAPVLSRLPPLPFKVRSI